jgi:hypothetical protein
MIYAISCDLLLFFLNFGSNKMLLSFSLFIMQMSSNANLINDPAAQHDAFRKMNPRFTFTQLKATDVNINPLKSWIANHTHRSKLLHNLVIAGAIIINDQMEFEPISMPTPMIEPKEEFDTAALWGKSLQSACFVAIDLNKLIGSILGIISKANAIEHKFLFFYFDLRKELIDRTTPADKLKLSFLPMKTRTCWSSCSSQKKFQLSSNRTHR